MQHHVQHESEDTCNQKPQLFIDDLVAPLKATSWGQDDKNQAKLLAASCSITPTHPVNKTNVIKKKE